jgi:perosamine synthetase
MTSEKRTYSRREFIRQNSLSGLGAFMAINSPAIIFAGSGDSKVPAILGGAPVRTKGWHEWPVWDKKDEAAVVEVLRSGIWCRVERGGHVVTEFEKQWAGLIGSKRCLAMVNGTNSLITSLNMLNVGAGDEVIVTPYTFIATINAILEVGAMPVFADIDPETFQIDPVKIEQKITSRTRAILPVHILGLPCDIVKIVDIAKKNNLVVVEDACQAWLAEVNNKKAGTFGNAGCFSFQNSKNLAIGEGGAIVSDDEEFMNRCGSYSDNGRPYGSADLVGGGYVRRGSNLRMTEYQAAIGLSQMQRLEQQTVTRNRNAAYLRSKVVNIPGILPYRLYDNVTRAAFHLFPFRYKKENFEGLPRQHFIQALHAEGIPASNGYPGNLNSMEYLNEAFRSKNFQVVYPKEMLDFGAYVERNRTPENEHLCNEEAVWFYQSMLLGTNSDMDDIYNAVEKIHKNAGKIKAGIK